MAALFGFEIGARDLAFAIPGLAAAMMVFLATFTPRSGVADLVVVTALALSFGGTAATSVLSASAGLQNPVRSRPGRAVVLADPDLAQEFTKSAGSDKRLLAIAKWTQIRIEPFFPYTALARGFLVHESGPNWLMPKLRQLRTSVQEIEAHTTGTLYRVRMRIP